jgi:hypothetical protein
VRTNRTIGMSQVQFGELLRRVEELVTWDKGVGRPRGLTLAQGLKATLMYFKNNITEEVIAELLFVSQSVISETISTLEGVIVKALTDFEPDLTEAAEGLAGRVAVIDGSLHPCGHGRTTRTCGRASTSRPGTSTKTCATSPGTCDTSPIRFPERPTTPRPFEISN